MTTTRHDYDRRTRDERDEHEHVHGRANGASVTHLIRNLFGDATTLLRKEMALAVSEVSESVSDVKKGASAMISGGAVLYAGVLFLLLSATLALAEVVDGWLAALLVGGTVVLIGMVMLQSAKKKLEARHFAPERTAESLRRDKEVIRRH